MNTIKTICAFGLIALPAFADPIPIDDLSDYLNQIDTVEAEFTQLNWDGTISTGTMFMHRPGRARFEYNPPEEILLMAGGGKVAVFDGRSNQPPEEYPLRRTPLSVILAADVDLSRDNMVVDYREDGVTTVVTAQDPEHPEYGNIQLVFTPEPIELRQWVITNQAGEQTTVILGDTEYGIELGSLMFNIPFEIRDRLE